MTSWVMPDGVKPELAATAACVGVAALGALWDLFTRRIPNLVTLGGLALGVAMHTAMGALDGFEGALRGAGFALLGALLCGILPVIGFARGEMGGGDVKLFAAIGAMLGPTLGFDAQAFTFVIVLLVLWPFRLARAGAFSALLRRLAFWRAHAKAPAVKVAPVILGPAIFCGLCLSLLRHGALR